MKKKRLPPVAETCACADGAAEITYDKAAESPPTDAAENLNETSAPVCVAEAEEKEETRPAKTPRCSPLCKKMIGLAAIVLFFMAAAILFYNPIGGGLRYVRTEIVLEAGQPLPVLGDYLYNARLTDRSALLSSADSAYSLGTHAVSIRVRNRIYASSLRIVDTTAPVLESATRIVALQGEQLEAADFILALSDATVVTLSFEDAPDTAELGEREVFLRGTDEGGNVARARSCLEVLPSTTHCVIPIGGTPEFVFETNGYSVALPDYTDAMAAVPGIYPLTLLLDERAISVTLEVVDVTPPVFYGLALKQVQTDSDFSYRAGVSAIDDVDGEVRFTVDASAVRIDQAGWYPVVYSAKDAAGNLTEETIYISVVPKPNKYRMDAANARVDLTGVTEEMAYALADEVLDGLKLDGLSTRQKVYKIYAWVKSKLKYVHDTENLDEYLVFYRTMKTRRADCYAYYATYAVLLTRAGIENLHITRLGGRTNHHWNLIYMPAEDGEVEGWYHSDTIYYGVSGDRRLFTEKQAQNYTRQRAASYQTYVYDHSLYPEVVWSLP
ncbi:MAG: transglutaminase-like domain-containing protein [Clostridiales bacterium]|nr:transglutaminase-like domain-containing protein [Clostridiales bacterium]